MPAPFSPDPADRPPGPRADKSPSTHTDPPTDHDPNLPTPLASPVPATPEAPTIITAGRPRGEPFDPNLGQSLAGRRLGHFELIEAVGAGGMAAVLRARDLDLGRVVALKILPPDLAADPENLLRFKQEARAAARLDHENIARVYYIGEDQGLYFIAFEFVEGDNLRQVMEAHGGTIPVPDAVALMLQVTAGLAHAAERGVVHRDIKPSNILVTPDGRAKIVDMGLARSLDTRGHSQLAETGVTLGTFDYISPEQATDPRAADVRSDIYSLGCTFYHALTGHLPVPEGTPSQKLDAQQNVVPPDPRTYNPAVPADLSAILGRMTAKDPDRRYQDPEHLAAHLRALAKKMGVPVAPSTVRPAYDDRPTGRQISPTWLLTSVAVLAVVVILMIKPGGWFRGGHPDDKGTTGTPDQGDPGPVVTGSRDAFNADELMAHLRQGVKHIRLTGPEYDLTKYRGADGHPVEAIFTGEDIELEGVHDPIVRLAYAPDGKARSKTLTLRGPGAGRGVATVRGVRFILPEKDDDDEQVGLLIAGFDRVLVEKCTFFTEYKTAHEGPAALGIALRGGAAVLNQCYFARGCVGVMVDGPGRLSATECAIGPQHAGIRVVRTVADPAGETELTLTHCSALMRSGGAVIDIGDGVPCVIRAGHCLFAGPDRAASDETPVVVRQRKDRAPGTRYEGEPDIRPNAYYHIVALSEGEETYTFEQAAKEKLPIKDIERPMKHPWESRNPFALLAARPPDPKRAFTQNLLLPDLRVKDDPQSILGTRYLGPDPLHQPTLPSPDSDARDATVKVWDPSLSETADNLPPGVFPTLARALAAVRRGDTLLIRYSGPLDVDPYEFTKDNTNLTIKPDTNYKPVLVPAPSVLKRAAGLFKLYGGTSSRLVLDGLHFRLPADRAPAVVVMPGGGTLEIRNSVITMEDGEDLAAVTLTDPRGEMMSTAQPFGPVPKISFENVFVRGKGRLMSVKGSRPFDLEVKNALAALDSTMIEIDPSTADPSMAGSGLVHLSRVTAYLGGSMLHFRAAERKNDTTPAGLARTEVMANDCLFVPAGTAPEPFVRADRLDSRENAERWFSWRGRNTVYGYDKKRVMLEIRPPDVETNPVKTVDGSGWLEITPEEADPFALVSFADRLPEGGQTRRFLGVRPNDFRPSRYEPTRPENAAEVGAPADVPAPFPDE